MSKKAAYLGFKRFIHVNPVPYEGKNHKLMEGIRKRLLREPCGTNGDTLSLSDAKTGYIQWYPGNKHGRAMCTGNTKYADKTRTSV